MTGTVDRRKFLAAAGLTAVGAATAGVGGELMFGQDFRRTTAAPAPGMTARASSAPPAARVPELKIDPMRQLAADETLDSIAGISPFFTPNAKFYRVDTSLVLPKVSPAQWQLRIHGMVDRPMTLTYDELIQKPMIDRDITLTCVSEAVGGNFIGNAQWQGTLLAPILRKARIQPGADQIVMRDVHGMTIGVATDPTLDGRDSMLAVAMNGKVLPQAHGYPVRVVIPGL
ncbi:MAG TPA: molybdopterin-dependent oxidoreductase, partial [Streptosporangiaceae bacterium]|nr:molybdopterin-dependent oxidoreductase [Streptosporangiaceae bacterium]